MLDGNDTDPGRSPAEQPEDSRGLVDWVVIGALAGAIAWNLLRLGQRLYPYGRGRALALESVAVALAISAVVIADLARGGAGSPWGFPASAALVVIAIAAGVPLYNMERAARERGSREGDQG